MVTAVNIEAVQSSDNAHIIALIDKEQNFSEANSQDQQHAEYYGGCFSHHSVDPEQTEIEPMDYQHVYSDHYQPSQHTPRSQVPVWYQQSKPGQAFELCEDMVNYWLETNEVYQSVCYELFYRPLVQEASD